MGPAGWRVDTVCRPLRPFFLAIAWTLGGILYLYYCFCRLTSRLDIRGPGNHDLSRHAIFCLWHESWWPYFAVFVRYRWAHTLMTHPAAYMKPVHVVFRLMGAKPLLLGSSGPEGRQAADRVAELVRAGCSTTISPDGPYGPPRVFKKGVLHMALRSGVPVVPLAIRSSRFIAWPSWDSKKFPLPFSRLTVAVGEDTYVTAENFDRAGERIAEALTFAARDAQRR